MQYFITDLLLDDSKNSSIIVIGQKKSFFIIIYKCSNKDLDEHMNFWYLPQMDHCGHSGLYSDLSLKLHLFFVCWSSDGSGKSYGETNLAGLMADVVYKVSSEFSRFS